MGRNVYADWVDFVANVLQEPLTTFPHERIARQLARSFPTHAVSWEWREGVHQQGVQVFSDSETTMTAQLLREWHDSGLVQRHPLQYWYTATGNLAPQTVGRVPVSIAPADDIGLMYEILSPHDVPHQLGIPYLLSPVAIGLFVLGRPEEDFDDHDLRLALRLQPLLVGLSRQARALGGPSAVSGSGQIELTGTERAVLTLLAEGHTSFGIAHHLGNSPRTVGKHLEHIYRKLGVSDRLLAVRMAEELGLADRRAAPADSVTATVADRADPA